jgi:PTH1 family peptidyl-tRNA hydrolase
MWDLKLARNHAAGPISSRFQGEVIDLPSQAGKVLLLCPATFMNRSGQSVLAALDFYKLPLSDLLVVCDDFSLPLGRLRFRSQGSAGGQKGLADIIRRVGSEQFARLRVGIGPPPSHWDPADYVLGRFSTDQRAVIDEAVQRAAHGVDDWLAHGTEYCMNQYNGT